MDSEEALSLQSSFPVAREDSKHEQSYPVCHLSVLQSGPQECFCLSAHVVSLDEETRFLFEWQNH